MSEDIRRMDEGQYRRAKKLIRGLCANCDGGNCLLLDDGETTVCPQLITYSVLCRYFRAAVLPADRELYADIMERDARRKCADCGAPFVPTGSRGVFCPRCAALRERRRKAEWARRNRGRE